jgi:hypothetical protein
MIFTVDRIVGDVVVLEDEKERITEVSLSLFIELPVVGDVVRLENGRYSIDKDETRKRRDEIFDLEQRLQKRFQ